MNQTSAPLPDSAPLSRPARFLWAVLILATLYLCYFHNLGVLGLVGPDEPRYAWIARGMAETGDWVTPRLYGKSWFEKPPLYYWGAALSFKLFGVSEVTARLPSAICALLTTLAMAWLAWRLYDAETARWLLLLLPTTVGMIGFSHAAATDMPFAAMLTMAILFATRLLNLIPASSVNATARLPSFRSFTSFTSSTSFTSLCLGIFLGLATLAKGPAALILSGGAILLWAAITKRWRDALRCLHPVAVAGFCLTALPWYILCARRNPDFLRIFIIEHNFKRFFTPEFRHLQPFWYYIPILLIAFLPWTLALLWSVLYGILRFLPSRLPSLPTLFLLTWSAFCLFFFSLSKSKLPGYILPAIPAIGVLLARSVTHLVPIFAKYFRWLLVFYGAVLLAIAISLFLFLGHTHTSRTTARAASDLALVLTFFALANWLLALFNTSFDSRFLASSFCVLPVLAVAVLTPVLLPGFFPYDPTGKTLAAELTSRRVPSDLFVAPMNRGQYFGLNFYLHRELQEWDKENPQSGYLLMRSKACQDMVKKPWSCNVDPIELPKSGCFVYRVERNDLMSGLGSGVESSGRARNNLNDRQPR